MDTEEARKLRECYQTEERLIRARLDKHIAALEVVTHELIILAQPNQSRARTRALLLAWGNIFDADKNLREARMHS